MSFDNLKISDKAKFTQSMFNSIYRKKNNNKIILRPVRIFLDEIEEIFKILYSKYKEDEIIIESDNYYYKNFEELSRSPEDFIYRLKVTVKGKKDLEINFKDNIYITSKYKDNSGLILKLKNILSNRKIIKASFPYYFVKYNRIWYNIFIFLVPGIFSIIFKNFQSYIFIFFLSLIFYVLWYGFFLKRNAEEILYSTIITYKKSSIFIRNLESKEKTLPKFSIIIGILGILIPFISVLINFLISKYVGK